MASNTDIPKSTTVLVIGGGPGGSLAATLLAREGIDTVLIEAEVHPRYHVGESMIPSVRFFSGLVDLEEKIVNHGFTVKNGASFQFSDQKRPGYVDFVAEGSGIGHAFNVLRSEFDEICIRHAAEQGVKLFEGTKVTAIDFEGDPETSRPIAADWKRNDGGATGKITFDYLVDASGRFGIMSTKYLKNRLFNSSLKNLATWAYFKGCDVYMKGTPRENVPFFEALGDESGWAWFIPLAGGQVSVGLVMDQEIMNAKKKQHPSGAVPSTKEFYLEELKEQAPALMKLIGNGTIIEDMGVKTASDFSYSAKSYAGPNYRLVGDAAAFIDPWFSTGIHLAHNSGLSAAATICASMHGQVSEEFAGNWHSEKFKAAYTRFLVCVLGVYKQIRNHNLPVLSDIDEDNFDRAFGFFKPVIQGLVDVKSTPSEIITRTMEFCSSAMDSVTGKSSSTEETDTINGIKQRRKVLTNPQDIIPIMIYNSDVIDGMQWDVVRGKLGLLKV